VSEGNGKALTGSLCKKKKKERGRCGSEENVWCFMQAHEENKGEVKKNMGKVGQVKEKQSLA